MGSNQLACRDHRSHRGGGGGADRRLGTRSPTTPPRHKRWRHPLQAHLHRLYTLAAPKWKVARKRTSSGRGLRYSTAEGEAERQGHSVLRCLGTGGASSITPAPAAHVPARPSRPGMPPGKAANRSCLWGAHAPPPTPRAEAPHPARKHGPYQPLLRYAPSVPSAGQPQAITRGAMYARSRSNPASTKRRLLADTTPAGGNGGGGVTDDVAA